MAGKNAIRVLLIDEEENPSSGIQHLLASLTTAGRLNLFWERSSFSHGTQAFLLRDYDVCLLNHPAGKEAALAFLCQHQPPPSGNDLPPILLITDNDKEVLDDESIRLGVVDYLDKGHLDASLLERSLRYAEYRVQVARKQNHVLKERDRYRQIVESASEGVWTSDKEGNSTFVNATLAQMLGYTIEEMLGSGGTHLLHEDDVALVRAGFQRRREGFKDAYEVRLRCKDGMYLWTRFACSPISDASGHFAGSLIMVTDISERKETERALRASEARFQAFMAHSPVAAWITDPAGKILYVSPTYTRMIAGGDPTGKSLFDIYPQSVAEEYQQGNQVVLATNQVTESVESGLKADGTPGRFLSYKFPVVSLEGESWIGGMTLDITEQEQTEEALWELERLAQSTVDALSSQLAILDESGTILAVNRSWREFAEANEATIENVSEGVNYLAVCDAAKGPYSEEAPHFSMGLRAVIHGERPEFALEYPCHSPNEQRWFIARVTRFPGVGTARVVVVHENITERKKAEQALVDSLERYHRTLDNMLEGCQIIGFDWRYLYVNDSVAKHGRFSKEELLGRTMMEAFPGLENTEVFARMSRCMEERTPYHMENKFEYEEGGCAWFDLSIQPVPEGIFVLSIDITERKKVEQALVDSLERYHHALDSMLEGCRIIGFDWRYIYVNDTAAKHSRSSKEEMLGKTIWDIVPGIEKTEGFVALRRSMEERTSISLQTRFEYPNGTSSWFDLSIQPVPEGIFVLSIDITERKKVEQALVDSLERYHHALDSMLEGCQIIGFDWEYIYVNDTVTKHDRRSKEELLGHTMIEVFPGIEETEVFAALSRCMKDRTAHQMQTRFVYVDGDFAWFDVSIQPIPEGLFVLSVDITERKQAEQALHDILERYHDALDNMLEGCQIIGFDWRYIYANDTVVKHNRRSKEEMLGRTLWEVFPGIEKAEVFTLIGNSLEQRTSCQFQNRYEYSDGTFAWFDFSIQPAPEGVFILSIDITERKQAEEELFRLNAELEERVQVRTAELEAANRELEAFSYSVSHDLRAPLRAINGFSRIVMEDFGAQLPIEANEYLQDIRNNSEQMGMLITDLLAFSRLSRQPINKQTVIMKEMVMQCLEALSNLQAGRQVEIRIHDLPPCQADPNLLKQVWLNLLTNSLKYTGKKDQVIIEVGCQNNTEGITYFVRDNGVGFDMRYAHKLFGVFQRLHRAEDYEGTGVGLAIVQRIVHRHGGRVWAEAEPNKGATFFFQLFDVGETR